jgi:hypothetical protein
VRGICTYIKLKAKFKPEMDKVRHLEDSTAELTAELWFNWRTFQMILSHRLIEPTVCMYKLMLVGVFVSNMNAIEW